MLLPFYLPAVLVSSIMGLLIPARIAGANTPAIPASVGKILDTYCISCHTPKKSKGKVTVHDLDGALASGRYLGRWDSILKMVRMGEMPPGGEKQPSEAERKILIDWIEFGMRDCAMNTHSTTVGPIARRLTNTIFRK